jgi:hypothetical protein
VNKGEREGILDVIGYILEYYEKSDKKVIATEAVIKDLKTIKKVVESK